MSSKSEENFDMSLYDQRDEFERNDKRHARFYSLTRGLYLADIAIFGARVLDEAISDLGKLPDALASVLNDGLLVAFVGLVYVSTLNKRMSESNGQSASALTNAIAMEQIELKKLELNPGPEQSDPDAL